MVLNYLNYNLNIKVFKIICELDTLYYPFYILINYLLKKKKHSGK